MHYPVALETGTSTEAYGVVVPDLPGCFSAGDTLDEAMANATEAIELWLEVAIDDGMAAPARPGSSLAARPGSSLNTVRLRSFAPPFTLRWRSQNG